MAHIPPNAKWWLADLIVEFTIEGEDGKDVHYNLTLIRADSAEEAYTKALKLGVKHNVTYTNTDGRAVDVHFRGLRDLMVIYDEIEDGAELLYEEESSVSEDHIVAAVRPKHMLSVFEPNDPSHV
jgi:hypothetical protein